MSNALAATELLIALLAQAARISEILRVAQAGERDLSQEEWGEILADNDTARARLEAAINKAKEEGR